MVGLFLDDSFGLFLDEWGWTVAKFGLGSGILFSSYFIPSRTHPQPLLIEGSFPSRVGAAPSIKKKGGFPHA